MEARYTSNPRTSSRWMRKSGNGSAADGLRKVKAAFRNGKLTDQRANRTSQYCDDYVRLVQMVRREFKLCRFRDSWLQANSTIIGCRCRLCKRLTATARRP